jgi:prepilin-type N-terminal cleavage/methylation domain-containing protein
MGRRGFTLLEVLLASAILAIIVTTVYGAVARSIMAKNHAEARAEVNQAGREAVLKIADEIEAALPPRPGSDVFFYGVPGQDRVPNDAVQFFRVIQRSFSAAQTHGGRALVTYALDPDGTSKLFALRRQEELMAQPVFTQQGSGDSADGSATPAAGQGTQNENGQGQQQGDTQPGFSAVHLLDHVVGLKFQYWNADTGDWVDSWDTTADVQPGKVPRLPGAVEIVVFLADEEGGVHDFKTIVDLPLANLQPTPTR